MINVVLFEPEIAENVGNIIRTCNSFNVKLHLIKPYGFFLNSSTIKRCSTNHLDLKSINQYVDLEHFFIENEINNNLFLFTKKGKNIINKIDYLKFKELKKPIYIMFGKESSGLPEVLMNQFADYTVRIPMQKNIVSINLSNSVAIAVYEILRQFDFLDLQTTY